VSGGLVALLDDVAALARIAAASIDDVAAGAAKAGAKAAGVVIDDAAVTPQYVAGAHPSRELPMIKRIFWGSLRNKLVIILPALLLVSAFIPGIIPFILMLGGTYLCYEGAEKVWHKLRGHHAAEKAPAVERGPEAEAKVTKGAITTDFILSCEIMVISMNEVADESLVSRALILIAVAIAITVLVYGAVALIVKMDDIGLHLTTKESEGSQRFGALLVTAMPGVLAAITLVGTVAMLWVGGHIMLQGAYDLGWHAPYDLVHVLEHPFAGIPVVGGFLAWLVNTLCSAVLGLAWGLVVLAIVHPLLAMLPFGAKGGHEEGDLRAAVAGHRPVEHDAGTGSQPDP
jgi:predicted DNA repair protein MutK